MRRQTADGKASPAVCRLSSAAYVRAIKSISSSEPFGNAGT